jgi:L-aminopeptidase/D-esterase-like protein
MEQRRRAAVATSPVSPGPRNLITDVPGLLVGNAEDHHIKTGTTVLIGERPFAAAVDVMGGAPGARETDLLAADKLVGEVDALFLSGGSAYGLDAGSGIMDGLRARGRGLRVETAVVPIVPGAIIFDLVNGGDKEWAENPYRRMGAAALAAAGPAFALGTAGAGVGATTVNLKGGLGSASLVLPDGTTVGALVAANPTGSVTMGEHANFWAAPFENAGESRWATRQPAASVGRLDGRFFSRRRRRATCWRPGGRNGAEGRRGRCVFRVCRRLGRVRPPWNSQERGGPKFCPGLQLPPTISLTISS